MAAKFRDITISVGLNSTNMTAILTVKYTSILNVFIMSDVGPPMLYFPDTGHGQQGLFYGIFRGPQFQKFIYDVMH